MEQCWPATLTAVENVDRIRLFAGGKELGGRGNEDVKTLKEVKLSGGSPGVPTPVHVSPVLKSSDPAPEKETAKPSQCQCMCAIL
eukprot:CAMPEP_0172721968 /NCGR_PEP_ID=MMETSP1074-20121228/80312_1 /TAXON_ID=2916 /ORGANISM="Ceratium fusus, Strain PA161109" /LENGTH=84 /DNA_ID=CAMNT_0013547845 /DNA_START=93 /DNA_END=347 /DNA_ORIENTATION=+